MMLSVFASHEHPLACRLLILSVSVKQGGGTAVPWKCTCVPALLLAEGGGGGKRIKKMWLSLRRVFRMVACSSHKVG